MEVLILVCDVFSFQCFSHKYSASQVLMCLLDIICSFKHCFLLIFYKNNFFNDRLIFYAITIKYPKLLHKV